MKSCISLLCNDVQEKNTGFKISQKSMGFLQMFFSWRSICLSSSAVVHSSVFLLKANVRVSCWTSFEFPGKKKIRKKKKISVLPHFPEP